MNDNDNNGKGLFYGVIGVATLIVAIIGATFAWFTATAGDETPREIIKTGTFTIDYAEGSTIKANNLKPATFDQVKAAYGNTVPCVDDDEEEVCAMYSFTVTNTGSLKAVVSATITLSSNPFTAGALKYALFSGTNINGATEATYVDGFTGAPSGEILDPSGGTTDELTYTLIFWLDGETSTNNDQEKTLNGKITVTALQTNETTTP